MSQEIHSRMIRLFKLLPFALLCSLSNFAAAQQENRYTEFEPKTNHYTLANNVNVRVSPDPKSKTFAKLLIGMHVRILEAGSLYTMNGVEAPWYKVSIPTFEQSATGYVWGGLIASQTFASPSDSGLHFHYGISSIRKEEHYDVLTVQVRAEKGRKELGKLEFDAIGGVNTYVTGSFRENHGLKGVLDVLELDYSDGFCGGQFGQVYVAWTGTALVHLKTITDGVDAPYVYDESLVFPGEEGGVQGKVVFTAVSNEEAVEQEKEDLNEMKEVELKVYVWDGQKLVEDK